MDDLQLDLQKLEREDHQVEALAAHLEAEPGVPSERVWVEEFAASGGGKCL